MTTMDVRPTAQMTGQMAGQATGRVAGRATGLATGFGSVTVLGGLRLRHPGRPAGYDGEWPELVRVEVELRNGTLGDVAVSLEQFRLRGCGHRQAVTPHVWGVRGGFLAPASTTRTWVDFWASRIDGEPWLEFHENRRSAPLAFAVALTSLV